MSEERRRNVSPNALGAFDTPTTSAKSAASAGASPAKAGSASQVVPVRIAGHEYKIRSSGDPDQLQQIASYVDRAMKRVRERTGTVDTLDVAVLTCLNLGREILALRERVEQDDSTSGVDPVQLRNLIERVEAIVAVDGASSSDVEASSDSESAPKVEPAEQAEEGATVARTLELPSVEALRDRSAASSSGAASHEDEGLEQSRVAAGGRRDRAS